MANVLTFICACGAKSVTTASQARRDGWKLATGTATCAKCAGPAAPIISVPRAAQVRIKCSECEDVTVNPNEFADGGLMPGLHWRADLLDDAERRDIKAAVRAGRKPRRRVPLCPGMQKPGIVLAEEVA